MKDLRATFATALAVVAVLALGACSDSDPIEGSFEATGTVAPLHEGYGGVTDRGTLEAAGDAVPVAFAERVAKRSDEVQRLRFSMNMDMKMSGLGQSMDISPDEPMVTGAVDEDRVEMLMDLGPMFEGILAEAGGDAGDVADLLGDMTIEMKYGSETVYMRAPYLAQLAALDPAAAAEAGPLGELGDGWGKIDATQIPGFDAASSMGDISGIQTSNPAEAAALLRSLTGDTYEVEETTVRDVDVTHYSGVTSFGDLMTNGQLPDDQAAQLGIDELTEDMLAVEIPIDFYVDADDRLRRIAYSMDFNEMFGSLTAGIQMKMAVSMDFFDFGDEGISVALPDDSSAVDITNWMLANSY